MWKSIMNALFRASVVLTALVVFILLGWSTENGKLVVSLPYETTGQKHWFATLTGTGDCLTWDTACTFRTAVGKCTSTYADVIHVGPGLHDLDNESDANGTDIVVDYVLIRGSGCQHAFPSVLSNQAGAVAHILRVSGDHICIENVGFSNIGQTDPDTTHIDVSGDFFTARYINIIQDDAVAVSGVGISLNSGSQFHYLINIHLTELMTSGIEINNAQYVEAKTIAPHECAIGIDLTNAADEGIELFDIEFDKNTVGIELAAGVDDVHIYNSNFIENTTNIIDAGDYDGLHLINVTLDHIYELVYPANAGITVAGDAVAWTQGNLTQIIPASTIITPFLITGINIQSATASNTFKLELFWGEVTGDNSLGIYEFTTGAAFQGITSPISVAIAKASVPSNSYIGAKVASSTGGGDDVVITISYQAL